MKVIGKTNGGYLLEASEQEIALIQGYKTNSSKGFSRPEINAAFDVQKIDRISNFVRNLNEDKLQFIKKQLLLAVEQVDEAAEVVDALTLFETLAEDDKS